MTLFFASMPARHVGQAAHCRAFANKQRRGKRGRFGPWPRLSRLILLLLGAGWLPLASFPVHAQEPTDSVRLPLFSANEIELSGAAAKRFEFRLPRHVVPVSGGQLRVTLRPAKEPVANAAVAVTWNNRVLLTTNVSSRADALMSLPVPVEPSWLRPSNTVKLEVVSLDTNATPAAALAHAGWSLRKAECYLEFVFTRPSFVAELDRFPHTLAEERLLAPESESAGARRSPLCTILLPGVGGMSHLRTAAIVAARLGQLDYLQDGDWSLAPLESWKFESERRHTVVIARRDQLGGIELPPSIVSTLSALGPGVGMIAEFLPGPPAREHRSVLLTGSDDAGLEMAALTAGSAPALAALTDNPAVLNQKPSLLALATETPPPVIEGLYQVQDLLLADRFGRQAAYVIPSGASLGQVRVLFRVWMELGRRLPASPILWPEVVTYQRNSAPASERLQNRNALVFGSVVDWPKALPPDAGRPALRMQSAQDEIVTIQGRRQRRAELEPTLTLAQLMPSPWSPRHLVVLVGGWNDYIIPATVRLLLSPSTPGKLGGNLAAMDALGRAASYELREVASESFAERLQRMIPRGTGVEETQQRAAAYESRQISSRRWNGNLSTVCGVTLLLLIAARLLLAAQQVRLRRRAFEAERSAGGTL